MTHRWLLGLAGLGVLAAAAVYAFAYAGAVVGAPKPDRDIFVSTRFVSFTPSSATWNAVVTLINQSGGPIVINPSSVYYMQSDGDRAAACLVRSTLTGPPGKTQYILPSGFVDREYVSCGWWGGPGHGTLHWGFQGLRGAAAAYRPPLPTSPATTVQEFWSDVLSGQESAAAQLTTSPSTVLPKLRRGFDQIPTLYGLSDATAALVRVRVRCHTLAQAAFCTTQFPDSGMPTTTMTLRLSNKQWWLTTSNFTHAI